MAKKTVATLQSSTTKKSVKIYRCVKNKKTDAYTFKTEFVSSDNIEEYLENLKKDE